MLPLSLVCSFWLTLMFPTRLTTGGLKKSRYTAAKPKASEDSVGSLGLT